ncbi:hypothetical protein E3E31_06980 [Thermococcus sp. M39]|uniref:hypothetical protein n=1 Tax=unclassified Thermococcus TaxID=2627626 RepID=UPI00143A6742|nr:MULTISPECIES: hypothetical protein [unclassified Thermococcus]NJE08266.1 hypothetical protein [Thermococcus sp. M39]NJE11759.1 hypothetical protein [Thermococcus sp. LS2]
MLRLILDSALHLLLIFMYYSFLKTAIEVFTYKKPRKLLLLTVSIFGVFISLYIDILLGFLYLFLVLLLIGLNSREAIVSALTAEFGFIIALVVVMFILTTIGTMYNIPGFRFEMRFEELLRYMRG